MRILDKMKEQFLKDKHYLWGRNRIDVLNKKIAFTRDDSADRLLPYGSKKRNANDNKRFAGTPALAAA